MSVRTRFAPSPTGYLHVGGARTALYCALEARRRGGTFVLRIEDTDRERSTPESVQAILDGLTWLGLTWDEGPYFQSQRLERYRRVAEELVQAGKAYRCYCTKEELEAMRADAEARGQKPRYNGYWRDRSDPPPPGVPPVIRFKTPLEGQVEFRDRVHGWTRFDNAELDDLVIWRSDDTPTYNFGVVIDDIDMRITDVIRGDDHLNNTPRQIHIYQALGAALPSFAHLPMILGSDGARLSKRHGAVSVLAYRDQGFLPEALLNYLVRLGWSHGDQEIFSRAEMEALFDVAEVNKAAARFDPDKLRWLNQHYLKTLPPERIVPHLAEQLRRMGYDPERAPPLVDLIVALRERVHTLSELVDRARCWLGPLAAYEPEAAKKQLTPGALPALRAAHDAFAALPTWDRGAIHSALAQVMQDLGIGLGKIGPALRVAITGSTQSPSIDETVYLAGRGTALERIARAIAHIEAQG